MEKNFLQKLAAGTQNSREVKIPNTDETVRINLLSSKDILDATLAADKIFKDADAPVNLQNVSAYEAEKDTQCLWRACRDAEGNPLAPNITEFRASLTVPLKDFLAGEYFALNDECNISIANMTDDELDTLLEKVKKNPNTITSVSNIKTLRRLVESLVNQSAK